MILKAYIENYGSTAFDIVSGAVVKENFNETLDSASINITNSMTRLELFPTQFVKLQSTDSTYTKYFIIDNFVETIENLDEGIYDYIINLASPLKLLEKVQLPNRTILHSLVESRAKLSTIIGQMMTLYCPKIKKQATTTTWNYDYIFDWNALLLDSKLLNTDCPDLSFNSPTLREVITTLLLVVGYLPTINHRSLTFIDLRATPQSFVVQSGRLYDIKRSNSIDSYVNTLQVQADNVLDTENKVVNEMLGFRDKDNVFLKHAENLKLETRFPIESIEKLELKTYVKERYNLDTLTAIAPDLLLGLEDLNGNDSFTLPNTKFKVSTSSSARILTDVSVRYYYDSGATSEYDSTGYSNLVLSQEPTLILTDTYNSLIIDTTWLVISPTQVITWTYAVITFTYNGVIYSLATPQISNSNAVGVAFNRLFGFDLTDIVFEQGKRKLLSTDYNLIQQNVAYSDFKNYYYLTLQYQYGGKEITGFSNTWSEFTWWGNTAENFMEFLWDKIYTGTLSITNTYTDIENLIHFPSGSITGHRVLKTNQEIVDTNLSKYSLFFFDIVYRPFNEINVRYTKEIQDIPYTIEQLDKQEASIPMFDEFSAREQDKVNRLGNNVIQIHQSQASDLSLINNLNTIYQDSTIFSREIAFYDDCFEVNYVATKNYVLKNYFTALQTKYRAYEYVDYNQTVLRKENRKVFVYIGTTYFNGDDHVIYGAINSNNTNTPQFLYSALLPYDIGDNKTFKYQVDGIYHSGSIYTNYDYYKNDLSIITYKNNLVFSHQAFDSVSSGIYLEIPEYKEAIGGYTQGWYINSRYEQPQICLYTTTSIFDLMGGFRDIYLSTDVSAFANISFEMPKLNSATDFLSQNYLRYAETRDSIAKLYYKSQNEVINQTLQFEYYTSPKVSGTPYFEFTEQFVNLNSAVFDRSKGRLMLFGFGDTTELNEQPYTTTPSGTYYEIENYVSEIANRGVAFNLSSNFANLGTGRFALQRTFKVIWWDDENQVYYDLFAIQFDPLITNANYTNAQKYNNGTIRAYFSMNDTKTNKVYVVNSMTGLYEQTREIRVNTTTRLLK